MTGPRRARRWPLVLVFLLGAGVALAPAMFQMFERAPMGGDMIVAFDPYMSTTKIDDFRDDLDEIGAAHEESTRLVGDLPADAQARFGAVVQFDDEWPAIDDDMRSMLTTMEENIGHYGGIAALPSFDLFPWFFVLPGVFIAGAAAWTLVADRGRTPARGRRLLCGILGIGLIAAPGVFQMFTRAPGGAAMIEDFEPFLTEAKVTRVQGYFLTIGTAEGQLRREVLPELAAAGVLTQPPPAIAALNRDWPAISNEMAPMVGTMADNVDNFRAVLALPPFWLFPWFFVLPGAAVVALAVAAARAPLPAHVLPLPLFLLPARSAPAAPAGHRLPEEAVLVDESSSSPSPTDVVPRWRTIARAVSAAVVVSSIAALAAMAIAAHNVGPLSATRLVEPVVTAPARTPGPLASAATAPVSAAPVARVAAGPVSAPTTTAPPPASDAAAPPAPTPPTPEPAPVRECALGLPAPSTNGGVASLTPLVPFFGPFSAEAFAMMPMFEPAMPLFGPLLAEGGSTLQQADPLLTSLAPPAQQMEQSFFDLIAPVYEPYRQAMLDGEAELANALAPTVVALATAPGTECVVAAEGMLVAPGDS